MEVVSSLVHLPEEVQPGMLFRWRNKEQGDTELDVAFRIKQSFGTWVSGTIEYVHKVGTKLYGEYVVGTEVLSVHIEELSYYDLLSKCAARAEDAVTQVQTTTGFSLTQAATLPEVAYFEARVMRGATIDEAKAIAVANGAKDDRQQAA